MATGDKATGKAPAILAGLIAGSSYGIGGAISQIVKEQGFEIAYIVVAQFTVACVVCGIAAVLMRTLRLPLRDMAKLVALGAVSTVSSYAYYLAIDLLSVGQAVAIQFQYVWIAVVITACLERTRPSGKMLAVSILIVLGSFLGSGMADEMLAGSMGISFAGVALALVCAFFYALFIVSNGKVASDHSLVPRTLYMSLGGLLVSLVALPLMGQGACDFVGLVPGGIAMALTMTIVPVAGIAFSSSRLSGGAVAVLTSLELPVAILAGCVLLGESVTPSMIVGVAIILLSIALSESGSSADADKTVQVDGVSEA